MNKKLAMEIKKLPKMPGVYFFKDKNGKIIYIGKANDLRARVRQYFARTKEQHPKITALISGIARLDWQECESGIDALIQEARLIKKHRPKFNVLMRDDKNYFFVGISRENFPCIFTTHQPAQIFIKNFSGQARSSLQATGYKLPANYIGPFTDGAALKQTLKILRRVFPFRFCRKAPKRPADIRELARDFMPYAVPKTKTEIRRNIKITTGFLTGKKQSILKKLEQLMLKNARAENYPLAEKYKNQLESLRNISAHHHFLMFRDRDSKHDWSIIQAQIQSILMFRVPVSKHIEKVEGYDISNIGGQYAVGSMVVFENGEPSKSQYRKFKIKYSGDEPNDPKMMAEILARRVKHAEWPMPDLIIVDGGITQLNAARAVLPKSQPVISLAKKEEEIYIPGKRVPIPAAQLGNETKLFLQHLRDEAHRFAIAYHRKLRKSF